LTVPDVIRKTRGAAKAAPSSSSSATNAADIELPEVSVSDDGDVRHLHLGTPWIQGSMRIREPFEIELEYVQRMMGWLLFMEPASVAGRHAMQLGLGAAAITKFCHKKLRMRTTAIELNPQVLAVCRSWFKLPPDSDTLRVVRCSSRVPRCCSRSATRRVTVGTDMSRRRAAAENPASSATV